MEEKQLTAIVGNLIMEIACDLGAWNRDSRKGRLFGPNTLFMLPEGSEISPCLSWVEKSRWEGLSAKQQSDFPPMAPDFVVEIRGLDQDLTALQEKMQDYMDAGVRLGWLIDLPGKRAEIYRPEQELETFDYGGDNWVLEAQDVLPGFNLSIRQEWVDLAG